MLVYTFLYRWSHYLVSYYTLYIPISGYVSVGVCDVGKGLSNLHSVRLKVSLTQLQAVLEQRQSLYTQTYI